MTTINLIPAPRKRAAAARLAARRWGAGLGAYAGLLALAGVAVLGPLSGPTEALASRASDAASSVDELRADLARVRAEVTLLKRKRETLTIVSEHPDWSRLLSLLAAQSKDLVVLDSASLNPTGAPGRARTGYNLRITGVGESMTAVSDFVLRLESLTLFDTVRANEIRARENLGRTVHGFIIDAQFGAPSAARAKETRG